jgi:hypothetical protein
MQSRSTIHLNEKVAKEEIKQKPRQQMAYKFDPQILNIDTKEPYREVLELNKYTPSQKLSTQSFQIGKFTVLIMKDYIFNLSKSLFYEVMYDFQGIMIKQF